jgi:type II secretion system protein G
MDRYLRRLKNQKGFTLVELMVVVVIIGVLVAIIVPIYGNVSANAKERACDANVRTLSGAAAMYHAEHGTWPADPAALVAADFLQEEPVCPVDEDATYTIDQDNGVADCDH